MPVTNYSTLEAADRVCVCVCGGIAAVQGHPGLLEALAQNQNNPAPLNPTQPHTKPNQLK